jgi:hypothetical protein
MAVRFAADGQEYTRTMSLGAQTAFSVSCWIKLTVDRNNYTTAWCTAASTTDFGYLQSDTDGTTFGYWDNGPDVSHHGARAMTVGTWYWWGVAVSGSSGIICSRAASDAASTVSTWTGSSSVTQTTLWLGESVFGTEVLNGCMTAFKWWGAQLTQDEMEKEAFQIMPARTQNLRCWYPFDRASTVDYSGNGATLTGSGATTEQGPPIPWCRVAAPRRGRSVELGTGWGVAAG